LIVFNPKRRALMLAREQAAAREMVPQRSGVSPRDVDAFVRSVIVVPDNSNPMRGVLAGEPEHPGKTLRANVFEANQADANHGMAVVQFRRERCGQLPLDHVRFGPEVHQQPPTYHAVDFWKLHHSAGPSHSRVINDGHAPRSAIRAPCRASRHTPATHRWPSAEPAPDTLLLGLDCEHLQS